jgi:hypothetical protein
MKRRMLLSIHMMALVETLNVFGNSISPPNDNVNVIILSYKLTSPANQSRLNFPCCHDPAVLFRMSYPGYPVMAVPSRLSCLNCLVPAALFCRVLAGLSYYSVTAVLPLLLSLLSSPAVLFWLSCPWCPVLLVLSRLSWAVLTWLSCKTNIKNS